MPSGGERQGKGESEFWKLAGKLAPIENSRFACGSELVIAKERFPVLGRGPTRTRDHVVGDGSLREGDAELEQLAVNPGSAPQRIGVVHVPDQGDEVWGNGFPASFARTAFPSPEESKPCAMPLKDGAGFNQDQPGLPFSPGLESQAQRTRSSGVRRGRLGFRLSTSSWCRRARISKSKLRRDFSPATAR
jgi:hypothetical protein